ncbi:hypothetical protein I5677_11435 [Mobilitalea sibirica]|uniref:DUF6472 domain-containing protein n=1 Tax=Mobilitalea sibirica TaxID=1462919 RepID=A0A8J7H8H2_9FIRM|nr:DUF6472 family protein [Mobilitalea sibirica]MBH1941506.1 hypothetical protein [Mobilitalea sibirica]
MINNTTICESCHNYYFDEDYDCYVCQANLDEDEMSQFLRNTFYNCPYYQQSDDYKIVRKQI